MQSVCVGQSWEGLCVKRVKEHFTSLQVLLTPELAPHQPSHPLCSRQYFSPGSDHLIWSQSLPRHGLYRELGGSSEGPAEPLNREEDLRVSLSMKEPEDHCDLFPPLTWATAGSGGRGDGDGVPSAQCSVVKP